MDRCPTRARRAPAWGLPWLAGLAALAGAGLLPGMASAKVYHITASGAVVVTQPGVTATPPAATRRPAPRAPLGGTTLAGALPASPSAPLDGQAMLEQAAAQAGLHPAVLEALVWQESRWRPDAVSRKGAIGLTQLMPDTARALGVDPRDPVANLNGGARHLRNLIDRFDGDLVKALAAYNAGARRVEEANGVPRIAETQNYVASIMGRIGQTLPQR